MKPRFDPVTATFGIVFILAGLFFANGSRSFNLATLGFIAPLLLIALGIAVLLKNRNETDDD